MRINNYISSTGFCSRRAADKLILEQRVTINGELAIIGQQVDENDDIKVDGVSLVQKNKLVYLALNKPRGITCTTERQIEGNIIDFINYPERIFPIGRLDKDSTGLILLTNDGDIVNKILDHQNRHEKEYIVTLNKAINDDFIKQMSEGVKIYNPVKNEYTITAPCIIKKINPKTIQIILTQGLNRQIRRMVSQCGYRVKSLKRIRIMNVHLGNLKNGEWRHLTQAELSELLKQI